MQQNSNDSELARISSFLLTGLFALMSFLLVVGVQSVPNNIQKLMFASIGLLSLSIVLFAVTNLVKGNTVDGEVKTKSGRAGAGKKSMMLKNMRIAQHLLFIVSIGVVAWLGIAVSQFFYKPVTSQAPPQGSSQQQPVEEQPPAETAPAQ